MDFTQFNSNPRQKPLLENPFLLQDMERNQFIHSRSSPLKFYHPKQQALRNSFKKPKKSFKKNSIPFYQSSKFQTPNNTHPRPRKPYCPKVFTRKHIHQTIPRPMSAPPPSPHLVNPSHSKKFLEMLKNVQPGVNTQVYGRVAYIIKAARWEGLVSHLGKRFFTHLMDEFYCNMRIIKGLDGVLHFTTYVDKKTILVDHKTINKALHLPNVLTALPCIDIYSYFMFNKAEFQIMLGTLCNSDVPLGLCDMNCSIHYKHFDPKFQHLALILRANILPKPNQSKFFDFFDIKVLFLLFTNKIDFSISYVILLNMINANLVDYMPYGLLLSSIFDIYHIFMPNTSSTIADSHITIENIRPQVPLLLCEPQVFSPTIIPPIIGEEDVFLASYSSVKMMIEEQKVEIRRLKTENEEIKGRLSYLEGLAASRLGQNGIIDMEIVSSFQVQMEDDMAMVSELGVVGVGTWVQGSVNLPILIGELGFVDTENHVVG